MHLRATAAAAAAVAAALCAATTLGAQAAPPAAAPQQEWVVGLNAAPRTETAADALAAATAAVTAGGGRVDVLYRDAVAGFAATMDAATARRVARTAGVGSVLPSRSHQAAEAPATGSDRAAGSTGARPAGTTAAGTESVAKPVARRVPAQLDRLDQRALPLDGRYAPARGADGRGVDVYVVDSGIRATHSEFGGRVEGVFSSVYDGRGTDDCAGHGTFVASQIAGRTFGVAKAARLKAVRMIDCANRFTDVQALTALDWMAGHVRAPAVVNLSLESSRGDTNPLLDLAVGRLVDAGLIVVLITGNFNRGDCQNSPKDARAVTVAASTLDDRRNTRVNPSSFGPCTTLFAPGADVSGAGIASDTAVQEHWSGTSFAAPLVAGVLAKRLQSRPGLTLAEAKTFLQRTATRGVLRDVPPGTPNLLLFDAG